MLVVAALGLAAAVIWWSGATLAEDNVALAKVEVQPLGGSLVSAKAFGPNGRRIPLAVNGGRLLPRKKLKPGEVVTVEVVVRRPGWLGWALGKTRTERLDRAGADRPARAALAEPRSERAAAAALRRSGRPGRLPDRHAAKARPGRRACGSGRRADGVRHRAGRGGGALVGAAGAAGARDVVPAVAAAGRARQSRRGQADLAARSDPADVLEAGRQGARRSARPHFSAPVQGGWHQTDSHTLVFAPGGYGFPLNSNLHLVLPPGLSVSVGSKTAASNKPVSWTVAGASFLRLQQLLAEEGYLPVSWQPSGEEVAQQRQAEVDAAVTPPAGTFTLALREHAARAAEPVGRSGQPNQITRGAVMMFEHDHDLAVDGSAGPQVWHALIADAIAGKKKTDGYSYVYVHRNVPQLLTLWHNGSIVLTSPGNTGVPAAPTALGTFPVFEHIPVGTMSGTNPDGSHYNDPGIQWISYFHGGDALHSFNRASFGTPQSLGCVELPLATAAKVWPYTPIGTLVTIEN